MPIDPTILIAILAGAAVLLITYGVAARPSEDAVQARLSQLVVQPKSLEEMELQQPFYERVMRPTIQRLARAGRRQDGGMIARTDAKLEKAGYPGGLRGADWIGVKVLGLIAFAILGFAIGLLLTAGTFVAALLFAFLRCGPRLHGAGVLARPQDPRPQHGDDAPAARRPRPADDLGRGRASASTPRSRRSWRRCTGRSSTSSARRWPRCGWAARGVTRSATSRSRADAQPVSNFIGAIVQAEQLGVPIAKVLQIQSNQLRIERRQRAEEAAAKAPVKMLFPMVGCIFPTIFIVILGPAIVTVMGGGSGL